MKRYLLFNGNCKACSQIAKEVAEVLDGWLEVRSFSDPSVRTHLDTNYPDWSWEPMILLESNPGKHRALTGARMKLFLVRSLGISKTLKIVRLIAQLESNPPIGTGIDYQRREFLKTSVPGF